MIDSLVIMSYNLNALKGLGGYSSAALEGMGGYSSAALEGMGGYSDAALEGMGGYSDAALEGMGGYSDAALMGMGSYSKAALKGMGNRLIKGSSEAKKRMAYLRSLRGKKKTKGGKKLRGGKISLLSLKPYFQQIKRHHLSGGGPITDLVGNSLGYWTNYFGNWHEERKAQKAEIERLKKKRDEMKKKKGGGTLQDIRDGFMGPVGWAHMIATKKRQREIEKLKKEVGEL